MAGKAAAATALLFNEQRFAKLNKVSRGFIQDRAADGMPWEPGKGSRKMYGPDAVEWLHQWHAKKGRDGALSEDEKAMDYRRELERQKVIALERDNAVKAGDYAPTTLMREYGRKVGAICQSMFEAFPGRVKNLIPHLRGSEISIFKGELAKLARDICAIDPAGDTPRA